MSQGPVGTDRRPPADEATTCAEEGQMGAGARASEEARKGKERPAERVRCIRGRLGGLHASAITWRA